MIMGPKKYPILTGNRVPKISDTTVVYCLYSQWGQMLDSSTPHAYIHNLWFQAVTWLTEEESGAPKGQRLAQIPSDWELIPNSNTGHQPCSGHPLRHLPSAAFSKLLTQDHISLLSALVSSSIKWEQSHPLLQATVRTGWPCYLDWALYLHRWVTCEW